MIEFIICFYSFLFLSLSLSLFIYLWSIFSSQCFFLSFKFLLYFFLYFLLCLFVSFFLIIFLFPHASFFLSFFLSFNRVPIVFLALPSKSGLKVKSERLNEKGKKPVCQNFLLSKVNDSSAGCKEEEVDVGIIGVSGRLELRVWELKKQ